MSAIVNGKREQVNVGREQVHVVESGPVDGVPLLLTTGLGGAWFDWSPTVELLRDEYRVAVFDRPGLGLSPAPIAWPTLRRDTATLEALAERAGQPVIVLAHSMAAFHAEALARLRPGLVRGMVLADPSYERDARVVIRAAPVLAPLAKATGVVLSATRLARAAGPCGRRLILGRTSRRDESVPDDVVRSVYGRGTVIGTVIAEELAYREAAADLARLRERRPFPPIPLVVVTALGDVDGADQKRIWGEGHARLAAMSPRGSRVELPDARHVVPLDRPDVIAGAVTELRRTEEHPAKGETA